MTVKTSKEKKKTKDCYVLPLFKSLDARYRPEDVAKILLDMGPHRLPSTVRKGAEHMARFRSSSLMNADFFRPPGMDHQLKVLGEILAKNVVSTNRLQISKIVNAPQPEGTDTDAVRGVLEDACSLLKIRPGHHDFKTDRMNREGRANAGLKWISRRTYNKLFRLLGRMSKRTIALAKGWLIRNTLMMAKSRLAYRLELEELDKDTASAAFITYYVAMMNRRSLFTCSSQPLAFDELAKSLFNWAAEPRKRGDGKPNWFAIAYVYPVQEVIDHLTERQKGKLLGLYFTEMKTVSDMLRDTFKGSSFKLAEMIVQRGDDSSTWNMAAGAWNKLRDGWISLVTSMGLDDILDRGLPGKAMRLMAADVARWHRNTGGDVHPDTKVWAKLPPPWKVMDGELTLGQRKITRICKEVGVDPEKSGWTAARRKTKDAVACSPTPELCHGVAVSSPELASLFRKWGIFSGLSKAVKKSLEAMAAGPLVNQERSRHRKEQESRK